MGRKPAGSDLKLIKAGTALARAKGLNGFTVREVCAKSKVNLGMFHYYFGTKDNFDMAVLKTLYSQMINNINIEVSPDKDPRENVVTIMREIGVFVKENRVLLSSLAGDVFAGNTKIIKFIGDNFNTHVIMLGKELKRAHDRKMLALPNVLDAVIILVAPVAFPQVIVGLLSRLEVGLFDKLNTMALGLQIDRGTDDRIECVLNAVFKGK